MRRDTAGLLQPNIIMKDRKTMEIFPDKKSLGHSLGPMESSEWHTTPF
jgi:hypothetical protein